MLDLALGLLARREHSRAELRRKLSRRFGHSELVIQVLDELAADDALSDRRFVEAYVEARIRRGFGPVRIRAELMERGIDGKTAALAIEAAADDWFVRLREVAHRKFGAMPAPDRREAARQARFLEQRGFPTALISRYLQH
jgi:regulatory protein